MVEYKRSISKKMRVEFRSKIALMKSDMIAEIVSAFGGVPRHMGIEGSYEEVAKDFEATKSRSEDRTNHVERPIGTRASQFAQPGSILTKSAKTIIEEKDLEICTKTERDIFMCDMRDREALLAVVPKIEYN
ncbi:hypothetical protein [Enterobacter hormaechei]|uniref:hypothetical protein n=1 Tax=Enterobacter hormaechei TaxID=158836 RepID=UPI0023E3719E|nr:hypothetical protein [Enterobacter hormaechei]MDF3675386.1 hypothetical protein [Enterobacter hormaechei]